MCVMVDKRRTHLMSKTGYKVKAESSVERLQEVGWMHSSDEVSVMGMERRRPAYNEILKGLS